MTTPGETRSAEAAPGVHYCPYLGRRDAGELPCAYATRHNVCHAYASGRGREYAPIARETQMGRCLEPAGGWPQCRHFLAAMAEGRPPLRELPGEVRISPPTRSRSRQNARWRKLRHHAGRRLLGVISGLLILLFSALLGLVVAKGVASIW